jgi:hypothetical protein
VVGAKLPNECVLAKPAGIHDLCDEATVLAGVSNCVVKVAAAL